jgi:hypothetical protein
VSETLHLPGATRRASVTLDPIDLGSTSSAIAHSFSPPPRIMPWQQQLWRLQATNAGVDMPHNRSSGLQQNLTALPDADLGLAGALLRRLSSLVKHLRLEDWKWRHLSLCLSVDLYSCAPNQTNDIFENIFLGFPGGSAEQSRRYL